MFRLFALFLALFCSSCSHEYSDFFPYHDDGTPKPHVALIPVINESKGTSTFSWDVAKEFTQDIRLVLMKQGKLFLLPQDQVKKQLASCTLTELTSTKDLMPFLYFQPAHFVVVMELVEHKLVPYKRGKIKPLYPANIPADQAEVLKMKMRLKVIDIRGGEPKLIRQEVLDSNHIVKKGAVTESEALHGSPAFSSSPLGLAYARFERDIAEKIERITSFQKR